MKTVSGAVVSSKPVSLSKAAKILSKFALADNGASPAYVAYLKRASDSFAELVQLHKEVRGSGSERKSKKHRPGNHDFEEPLDSITNYGDDGGTENGVRMRWKDVKQKNAGADGHRDEVVLVNGQDEGKDPKKKKKKNVMDKSEEKGNGSVKMEEERTQGTSNLETFDDSAGSKKRKKELKDIKKDAIEEGRNNGVKKIEKGPSDGGYGVVKGDQFDDMKNEVFERKKDRKTNKGNEVEKRENKAAAGLRNERYAGNGDFDSIGTDSFGEKKVKKKHIREEEGRDGESKTENKNEKKRGKKRKSEQIADGELTDSVEKRMHKKKKKGKSEGDN